MHSYRCPLLLTLLPPFLIIGCTSAAPVAKLSITSDRDYHTDADKPGTVIMLWFISFRNDPVIENLTLLRLMNPVYIQLTCGMTVMNVNGLVISRCSLLFFIVLWLPAEGTVMYFTVLLYKTPLSIDKYLMT